MNAEVTAWIRAMRALGLLLAVVFAASCARPEVRWTLPELGELRRLGTGFEFVEGPVWCAEEDLLLFSDIPARLLRSWSPDDGAGIALELDHPNGSALDSKGRLVTCLHGPRAIARREFDGGWTTLVERVDGLRFNSPNDLVIQPDGVIWFTDPPWGLESQTVGRELPVNGVYRFDPATGDVRAVLVDMAMPNGIALSPDGATLYVSDTGGHPSHPVAALREGEAAISAYALSRGELVSTVPLWSVAARSDGMCVDRDGRLYATATTGVSIWTPGGERLAEIPVPECPANVCIGGRSGSTLFVTARTSLYAVELR